MNKIYILEDLDCAHCAAKIEAAVGELEGVTKSTCTLLTQKLTVEFVDSMDVKKLTKDITKIVKKFEPDVTVEEA